VKTYYASEIDKHAIQISQKNYPDIVRLGDVRTIHTIDTQIDLLIGGSPCQDLSIAKKDRQGLEGNRSSLFWEYVRIKDLVKPRWFILENVASMPKKDKDIITKSMGVVPVLFNASLVSAQCRKRLFWTNIAFSLPEDRGIVLKDILQPDGEVDERFVIGGKSFCLTASYSKASASPNQIEHNAKTKQRTMVKLGHIGNSDSQGNRVYDPDGKAVTLSANGGGLGAKTGLYQMETQIRKLTPIECERLQGLPDNYTEGVAMTHRYKCLGNAFNVDVVSHILKFSN
jgi:DNA (cytosine-5)-methyltransferase 3A